MSHTQVQLLRLYIADPESDPDKMFDNDKLEEFIAANPEDLHAVAADVWGIKAGSVADWYMAQTDGSMLARQQVFDHCLKMQDYHQKAGGGTLTSVLMDGGSLGTEDTTSEFG